MTTHIACFRTISLKIQAWLRTVTHSTVESSLELKIEKNERGKLTRNWFLKVDVTFSVFVVQDSLQEMKKKTLSTIFENQVLLSDDELDVF